jgi:hypothetical protein
MKKTILAALIALSTQSAFAVEKIACGVLKENADHTWSVVGDYKYIDFKKETSGTLSVENGILTSYSIYDNRISLVIAKMNSQTYQASAVANSDIAGGASLLDLNAKLGIACSKPTEFPN